jgi:hypothetical protein
MEGGVRLDGSIDSTIERVSSSIALLGRKGAVISSIIPSASAPNQKRNLLEGMAIYQRVGKRGFWRWKMMYAIYSTSNYPNQYTVSTPQQSSWVRNPVR